MAFGGFSGWVHLDVDEIVAETPDALLIRFEDGDREEWIPKRQIADADQYSQGDQNFTVSITEWIANKKDIEE